MRKTTQYFSGKLTLMYKTNNMDWLREEIRKSSDDESYQQDKRSPRMYYQYKTLEEIERSMSLGEVLSGFTFEGNGDNIMIAYGERRRFSLLSCIGITRLKKGVAQKCAGLAFVKCRLDDAGNILENVDVETLESKMKHYCIMLPLLDNGDFGAQFAIVYDDWDVGDDFFWKWDVGDEFFWKCLPSLCTMCFEVDILS